jgi:hypothetical protein
MAGGSRDCSCPPQSRHVTGERPAPEIGHPGYTVLQNAPSQTATLLKTGEGGRKAESGVLPVCIREGVHLGNGA